MRQAVVLKSAQELVLMRRAGAVVAQILRELAERVVPGVRTAELDQYAERRCAELGVLPAFKGYPGIKSAFPATVCISINDEVVHGIPSTQRVLKEGDIVGLDFGVSYQGWFGDSARTVPVGPISAEAQHLLLVTEESLRRGIAECVPGRRLGDIGFAVQNYVEKQGYSVVREFVGHGIGRRLHEEPAVPNFGESGKGLLLQEGMVLAIEPMVNRGRPGVKVLKDGWTVQTGDRSLSAHFEHTVAILATGPEILTQ